MAVIRKEAYFSSSNSVDKVRTLIWHDDEVSPIGVIQIAHGVCEHIGRYDEFARFLAGNGFVVCGNDHLGHGKTAAAGDLGYVYEGDHVNMVRDMNTLHNIMEKRYPELPYIMFGHSMGSFLARIYAANFGERLSAAIFCGTGQLPPAAILLDDPVDYIINSFSENSEAPASAVSVFEKMAQKYFKEEDNLSWLSKSKTNIENYRNDPLSGFHMTAPLLKELVMLAVKVSYPTWPSRLPKDLPILLISGAKDPIGMFGRGVLQVSDNLVKEGIEPEVILYPADRHEILNEDDRDKVYADVLTFLKGVIDGKACAE